MSLEIKLDPQDNREDIEYDILYELHETGNVNEGSNIPGRVMRALSGVMTSCF